MRIKSFILRYLDREKEYLGAKSPKFLLEIDQIFADKADLTEEAGWRA